MMGGSLAPATLAVLLGKLFIRQNGIAAMQNLQFTNSRIRPVIKN